MRILHLTTHLNRGGISQYLFSVGGALVKQGHEVFVVSSGGETEEELRSERITVRNLPIRTKSELSPQIYWHLPELIRWIRDWKIDVIHAHTRVTQVMAWWAQRWTQKPLVTTVHGFYKRRLGRRLLPAWGERAIAISEAVGTDLRETHRVPTERIRVIYNGVALLDLIKRFSNQNPHQVRLKYGFSDQAYVVSIIARLVPDKGHEYLIRAIKRLESEIPDLGLLIVGDGRYRPYLEELASKLDLRSRVRFTGNLRDVTEPLAATNLFVLPAVWREGFGLSIVEAMTCQKPVIVTNIWALNTLIQNHVNGILVEPRDPEDLARAIRLLVQNPELSRRMGTAGHETARERFSIDRVVEELEKVYGEVLSH